jgi:hypothetical protein
MIMEINVANIAHQNRITIPIPLPQIDVSPKKGLLRFCHIGKPLVVIMRYKNTKRTKAMYPETLTEYHHTKN